MHPNLHRKIISFGATCFAISAAGLLACPVGFASEPSAPELAAIIDRHIESNWSDQGVVPAERSSDAEFSRRAYLDLLGRIPKVAEVRRFLNDAHDDKRETLVDELMARPAFTARLAEVLRGVLMPRTRENPELYHLGLSLEDWLRPRIQQGLGYDKIIHELLTVPLGEQDPDGKLAGEVVEHFGAVAWYQINDVKPENIAAAASRQILGLKLECAQCHDHPFDEWSQDQLWQTAAFFSRLNVRSTQSMGDSNRDGKATNDKFVSLSVPHTNRIAEATFLNGEPLNATSLNPRVALADWMTAKDNPYFAHATANRIWEQWFGRGLVSPADDFRPDNPASHPKLLVALAAALVEHDFDLKFLIRSIMLSEAYQRTSSVSHPSQLDPLQFARMQERPMTAEQLWSSLVAATGHHDPLPLTHRGLAGMDMNSQRVRFLVSFLGESRPDLPQISILHSLKLLHGDFLDKHTDGEQGPIVVAVSSLPFLDQRQKVETLYLAALARLPTTEETSIALEHLQGDSIRPSDLEESVTTTAEKLGDLLWALLNSPEFMLNH